MSFYMLPDETTNCGELDCSPGEDFVKCYDICLNSSGAVGLDYGDDFCVSALHSRLTHVTRVS